MTLSGISRSLSLNDDPNLVSEEDSPLSQHINDLMPSQFRFIADNNVNIQELTVRGHDFGMLVKESPFAKGSQQHIVLPKTVPTLLDSKIGEISTISSFKKDDISSINLSPHPDKKTVTFCDRMTDSHSRFTLGILKSEEKCRYSPKMSDQRRNLVRQSSQGIPPWGKDWDALEKDIPSNKTKLGDIAEQILRKREKAANLRKDINTNILHKENKKANFLQNQISRVKRILFPKKSATTERKVESVLLKLMNERGSK